MAPNQKIHRRRKMCTCKYISIESLGKAAGRDRESPYRAWTYQNHSLITQQGRVKTDNICYSGILKHEDLMLTIQNWHAPKYQLISFSIARILPGNAIQL